MSKKLRPTHQEGGSNVSTASRKGRRVMSTVGLGVVGMVVALACAAPAAATPSDAGSMSPSDPVTISLPASDTPSSPTSSSSSTPVVIPTPPAPTVTEPGRCLPDGNQLEGKVSIPTVAGVTYQYQFKGVYYNVPSNSLSQGVDMGTVNYRALATGTTTVVGGPYPITVKFANGSVTCDKVVKPSPKPISAPSPTVASLGHCYADGHTDGSKIRIPNVEGVTYMALGRSFAPGDYGVPAGKAITYTAVTKSGKTIGSWTITVGLSNNGAKCGINNQPKPKPNPGQTSKSNTAPGNTVVTSAPASVYTPGKGSTGDSGPLGMSQTELIEIALALALVLSVGYLAFARRGEHEA